VPHDIGANWFAGYGFDTATNNSALLREYIWQELVPVAVIEHSPAGKDVYPVRTDHIGRLVFATDDIGTKV